MSINSSYWTSSTTSDFSEEDIGIKAERAYNFILHNKDIKNLPIAEKILRDALNKSQVNRSENKVNLANCLYFQGKEEEAIAELRSTLKEYPDNFVAMSFLANKISDNEDEEVIELSNKSSTLISEERKRLYNINLSKERLDKLISQLNVIEGINYFNRGGYYFNKEQYDISNTELIQAQLLTPKTNGLNTAAILNMRGHICIEKNNLDGAKMLFEEATQYENFSPAIYTGLAEICCKKKNYMEAVKYCVKAFNINNGFIYGNLNNTIFNKLINIFESQRKENKFLKESMSNIKDALSETQLYGETSKVLLAFFQHAKGALKDKSINEDAANLLCMDPCLKGEEGALINLRRDATQIIRPTHLLFTNTFGDYEYIIKMNNPGSIMPEVKQKMKDEYITQLFLATALAVDRDERQAEKYPLEIEEPLFYLENSNGFVSIQNKIKSITLKQFEENSDISDLETEIKRTINSSLRISSLATRLLQKEDDEYFTEIADGQEKYRINIKNFDYEENLERRFLNRLNLTPKEKEKYKSEHFTFVNMFENHSIKYFIHGDLNACNAMVGGQLIDFEMKAIGNPMYDFMHLITNIDFADLDSVNLKRFYIERLLTHEFSNDKISQIIKTLDQNRIHIQVCKIGSNINQGQHQRAKAYLDKTLQDLERLNLKDLLQSLERATKGQIKA
jgi:tetratricopeptide (TPR) repeat protein